MNKRKAKKQLQRQLELLRLPTIYGMNPMEHFINYFSIIEKAYNDSDERKSQSIAYRNPREIICLKLAKGLGMNIEDLFFRYHELTGYPFYNDSKHSFWNEYKTMPTLVNRDNKKASNRGSGYSNGYTSIRVPSLKRSNATWRNFYDLFPRLKGQTTFRGYKLKQID